MMVLSQVGWNNNNEDNNNSIKKDILRTPPSEHGHSRCTFCFYSIFFPFVYSTSTATDLILCVRFECFVPKLTFCGFTDFDGSRFGDLISDSTRNILHNSHFSHLFDIYRNEKFV